jgi:glycosyltransferase involved in cell wall biosynthesis
VSANLPDAIGINAVFLEPRMGGVDVYVRSLMPELITLAPNARFTVYCGQGGYEHLKAEPWAAAVDLVMPPLFGRRGLKAIGELTVLGAIADRRVELLHSMALTGPVAMRGAHLVTLHDVTWLLRPPANHTERMWRLVVPTVARRADRVIAVSQAAANDVERYLRVPAARIDVTLEGYAASAVANPLDATAARARFGLGGGPLVLMVGTRKEHKNIPRMIEAMPEVIRRRPGTRLVLAGHPAPDEAALEALAERAGVRDGVVFLGFVDDAELEGLYSSAACFVLASTNEGFGLPVAEAMAHGVPVACSSAASLPEVAGDAGRYFDPYDVAEIARAIADILTDERLAHDLVAAGRRREAGLSWKATAEATLASYERAWHGRG